MQLPVLPAVEAAKRLAAFAAVDRHVGPDDKVSRGVYLRATMLTPQVIGIGSGSTVPYVVDRIVAQGEEINRNRVFVPTGRFCPVDSNHADVCHRLPVQGAYHQSWPGAWGCRPVSGIGRDD